MNKNSLFRASGIVVLMAAVVLPTASAQDKHIDPSPKAHKYSLTVKRHAAIAAATFTEATVKSGLANASADLQLCNSRVADDQDVGMALKVELSGSLGTWGTATDGLDVITTAAEMDSVLASKAAYVKVVTSIGDCGGPAAGIIGCAPTPGASIAVIAGLGANGWGETTVHELGHNKGLNHRNSPGKPIMSAVDLGNTEVNSAEAAAFHVGGTDDGPNRPVQVAFVIDDTGSMSEEISGVRSALSTHLGTYPAGACVAFELDTFKDDVTNRAPTTDLTAIRTQVGGLSASGGGDCPEASVEALNRVLPTVCDRGRVLLATDADPHPGQSMAAAAAAFRARSIRVDILLSGTCDGSAKRVGNTGPLQQATKNAASKRLTSSVVVAKVAVADTLSLGDDDAAEVLLPFQFPIGGTDYASVWVGSNGFVTFGEGRTETDATTDGLTNSVPRIAFMWTDLNPRSGGYVIVEAQADRARVTYEDIPPYSGSGTVNSTLMLHADGSFTMEYGSLTAEASNGLVGATIGRAADPGSSDLSSLTQPIDADDWGGIVYESFSNTFDLGNSTLSFAPITTVPPRILSGVENYALLARQTGGIFAFIPEVNNGDASATERFQNVAFNIVQGGLTQSIAYVEPPNGPVGGTVTVTLTGASTNFQASTALQVSGDGITVSDIQRLSPTSLRATLSIGAGAALGFRDLLAITDLGGGQVDSSRGTGSFEIVSAPASATILGISPPTGEQGSEMSVTISGMNTSFSNASVVNLGAGITVQSVSALSATSLQATISIAANAVVGFRDVQVTTDAETAMENAVGPFFVAEAVEVLTPEVASITPSAAAPGSEHTVFVTGTNTNFVNGISEVSFSGRGIEVLSTSVSSATSLTASIRLAPDAPAGFRDARVTTDAEVAVLLNAFFVTALVPEVPALDEPADGMVNVPPAAVTISWLEATRATSYRVQIATDASFAAITEDLSGVELSHVVTLTGGTTYYWRVQAINDTGASEWTPVRTFSTVSGVDVESLGDELPDDFAVYQNYPNPFNPRTLIRFDVAEPVRVEIRVFNALGQLVMDLVDGVYAAGRYEASFDASNLPSGVYLYQTTMGSFRVDRSMILQR